LSYYSICSYYKMHSTLFRYSVGNRDFSSTILHHFETLHHNISAEYLAHNLCIANQVSLTYFTVSDVNEQKI